MKNLGFPDKFVGITVKKLETGGISLDLENYINETIKVFGMQNANEADTPLAADTVLEKETNPENLTEDSDYRSIIGKLNFASNTCRPDIATATNILAQFSAKHNKTHLTAAKRVLRYLKRTAGDKLIFNKIQDAADIVGYADANWTNEQDGKSRSGVLFKLYGNTIYWRSNKQDTISLSSAEAELVALTDAAKEAKYLDMLLNHEIGIGIQLPITIHEDNEACIAIANDPKHQHRTKHIRLKHLAIRDWSAEGTIKTASIRSKNMIADTLTKVLPRCAFSDLKDKMRVIPSQQPTIVEGN